VVKDEFRKLWNWTSLMTWPMPACAGVVVLEGLDGEVEDPDARACLGRSSPQLLNMKNLVLMSVPAGGSRCCTLARALRRWKPRNHAEQQRQ